ncbi:hypothetical protein V7968_16450 [Nocardia vulneris]|uniref:hypothetical protein n=1 Tax=Nocardia vulneris TaxID=1141657 RepID=UPI0030CD8EC1
MQYDQRDANGLDDVNDVEHQYADVLALLARRGYIAGVSDTGGGCLAIEIAIGDSYRLLATDKDELLAEERVQHKGWRVGLYGETDSLAELSSNDGSADELVKLIGQFDDHIVNKVGTYVMLAARHPGAPDWQKQVDALWSYCSTTGRVDIYRQGYQKAEQALGL